jgi:para-aminobenzoate synthetase component 1
VRKSFSFVPEKNFINKALQFADKETHAIYLNPNSYEYPHSAFQHILAFGVARELNKDQSNHFETLKEFLADNKDWAFGYFSYDLKNEIENLESKKSDNLNFPLIDFFIPKHIIFFNECEIEILSEEPETIVENILKEHLTASPSFKGSISLQQKISREHYIEKIKKIQELILEGEIYETNFCMEYFAENVDLDPLSTYHHLNRISPMPFSSYLKINDQYVICASPERFLKKENLQLISQPIKGTAKRGINTETDALIKEQLSGNQKERSENIMIVDLVRNDLSRSAIPGSVVVEELCRIYSFPMVHQMISTVTATLETTSNAIEVICNAFPMGSMTGAPKVRAMQLIEKFEESYRGVFSGSIGYFTPEIDFDFNVVIRSILYNKKTRYLSFQAGSAITYYAEAEKEYEECSIKTSAIRQVLKN